MEDTMPEDSDVIRAAYLETIERVMSTADVEAATGSEAAFKRKSLIQSFG